MTSPTGNVPQCCCGTSNPKGANIDLLNAGSIYIPAFAPANYTFYLDSDDGSLLMIDGNVIISDPGAVILKQLVTHAFLVCSVSLASTRSDRT